MHEKRFYVLISWYDSPQTISPIKSRQIEICTTGGGVRLLRGGIFLVEPFWTGVCSRNLKEMNDGFVQIGCALTKQRRRGLEM